MYRDKRVQSVKRNNGMNFLVQLKGLIKHI